jgi:hypothetical protein
MATKENSNLSRFLQKTKIELPLDVAILLLDEQPKKMESYVKDTHTPLFIEEQFAITNTGNQPKCP